MKMMLRYNRNIVCQSLRSWVAAFVLAGVVSESAATSYYWYRYAGDGAYENLDNWRSGSWTGSAVTELPVPGTDNINFYQVTNTVTFSSAEDFAIPLTQVRQYADTTFLFPEGVVTHSTNGFGFTWDGSASSAFRIGRGVLDRHGGGISRGNGASHQVWVLGAGTEFRNSAFAPGTYSNSAAAFPLRFAAGPGTALRNITLTAPSASGVSAEYTICGPGTYITNVVMSAPSDPTGVNPFRLFAVTNGVTVDGSLFDLVQNGAEYRFAGPDLVVTNGSRIRARARSNNSIILTNGVDWTGGSIRLGGDAGNEYSSNTTVRISGTVFRSFYFSSPGYEGWGKNDIRIGPAVTLESGIDQFFLGGGDRTVITGPGTDLSFTNNVLYFSNTTKNDNGYYFIENGAKVSCRRLVWNAGPCTNTAFRIAGEGSELRVSPSAADVGNGLGGVFLMQANSTQMMNDNVFRVEDGAVLLVEKQPGMTYSYLNGVAFGRGSNVAGNRFEVLSGGAFTNEFHFYFGNNYYTGGHNNALLVSNGTFRCEGDLHVGDSGYSNAVEVVEGGNLSVANIYLSGTSKSGGSRITVRNAPLEARTEISSASPTNLYGACELRIGGETGGVDAPYVNNSSSTKVPFNLAFEIPAAGRTDAGAYLRLTNAVSPLASTDALQLVLDISQRWALKPRNENHADLISVPASTANTTILETVASTASAAELGECSISVVTESGLAILRLTAGGNPGTLIKVM